MLEMRLNELAGKVDRHVIVESPFTAIVASPSRWFFDANKERFRPWMDRITYLVAEPDSSRAVGCGSTPSAPCVALPGHDGLRGRHCG